MVKKMLVGFIIDGKHSGIDKYLLGFATVAKENGVVLDFLTDKIDPELKARLNADGFGLLEVPSLKKPIDQYKAVKQLIEQNGYDSVYCNISEAFNCMLILAAEKCKVPVRIVHSHSAGVDRANKYVRKIRTLLHNIFKKALTKKATDFFACSQYAGKWMFECDFNVIFNAVDFDKFSYKGDSRKRLRDTLGILDSAKVLVHVGNMCYVKNNFFLVDLMYELVKTVDNSVLLCVGTGPDEQALKEYTKELCLDKNIKFLGVRSDVADILCAADVFVFPSRFEGMPVTAVEAQASGLYCIVSDTITPEVILSERTVAVPPLVDKWIPAVSAALEQKRTAATLSDEVISKYSFANAKTQLLQILERE